VWLCLFVCLLLCVSGVCVSVCVSVVGVAAKTYCGQKSFHDVPYISVRPLWSKINIVNDMSIYTGLSLFSCLRQAKKKYCTG